MTENEKKTPFVIVFGNEKGGTGKSTLSMHVILALCYQGYRVKSFDIDSRQGTLSRYIENRLRFCESQGISLPSPDHTRILPNEADSVDLEDRALNADADFVVFDTPGSDTALSRRAHCLADLLITPMNESFVDLDLLIRLDDLSNNNLRPSIYAEMIWEQKMKRATLKRKTFEWFIVRNRVQSVDSRNKAKFGEILDALAGRWGYQTIGGLRERTIFRELFIMGLTLLDKRPETRSSLSHVAARQEIRQLIAKVLEVAEKSEERASLACALA